MKKKPNIKKIRLPLKKMPAQEKDYAAVLMEDMNHNVKAFWEVLSDVKRKGNATFEEVGKLNEKVTLLEFGQKETNKILISVENQLVNIKQEIVSIKNEIKELRLSLNKKADIAKLEEIEIRISKIESHLKLSVV